MYSSDQYCVTGNEPLIERCAIFMPLLLTLFPLSHCQIWWWRIPESSQTPHQADWVGTEHHSGVVSVHVTHVVIEGVVACRCTTVAVSSFTGCGDISHLMLENVSLGVHSRDFMRAIVSLRRLKKVARAAVAPFCQQPISGQYATWMCWISDADGNRGAGCAANTLLMHFAVQFVKVSFKH